ncbi:MAG: hypothetical protein KAV87_31155 [Desulfobacteraceae bacterium]|nr:hypothetical protein [Desulfobacteraceae bacterium]
MLHRFERWFYPLFLAKERLNHIFCQGNKVLANATMSSAGPVILQSQKEKKEASEQAEIIVI